MVQKRLQTACAALFLMLVTADAFTASAGACQRTTSSDSALSASRRDILSTSLTVGIIFGLNRQALADGGVSDLSLPSAEEQAAAEKVRRVAVRE